MLPFHFVTHLFATRFNIHINILHEPFLVSTLLDDLLIVRKIYRGCPISLPNRVT